MILVYAPADGDEQRWEFQLGRLRVMEIEAIEKRTDMAYDTEFRENLLKGQVRARRALLWTMLRRQHPTLRFDDVDFAADELRLEFDRSEWQSMYDDVAAAAGLSDEDREFRLALIGAEIAKLDGGPAGEHSDVDEAAGKAPSAESATATG